MFAFEVGCHFLFMASSAANVGTSVGLLGTDAARQAAGLVLMDNGIAAIVRAIYQGRVLFDNLMCAIIFSLACKLSLLGPYLLAVLIDTQLTGYLEITFPMRPLHIILVMLITDGIAATAFTDEVCLPSRWFLFFFPVASK
jgi:Ca2+-transporting ATPase